LDDGGRGVRIMRNGAAGERQVLWRVRCPNGVSGDTAEYKQVTVLFADVVHSMDIAAALDMGAVARGHDRVGGALGGGSAPPRRNGTVIWVIWLA
jgi:class 3 adenylate cyclase